MSQYKCFLSFILNNTINNELLLRHTKHKLHTTFKHESAKIWLAQKREKKVAHRGTCHNRYATEITYVVRNLGLFAKIRIRPQKKAWLCWKDKEGLCFETHFAFTA